MAWYDEGERTPIPAGGASRRIWNRAIGEGPWTTFLHGFPTSSLDWEGLEAALPRGRRRLYLDLLGFGHSDKPVLEYTFSRQLNVVQQIWKHHGVEETVLVVHDYSVSIAQEILWRMLQGTWEGPRILGITFLNGGLFASQQRPLPIQKLLASPLGRPVAGLARLSTFQRNMARICEKPMPDVKPHWQAMMALQGRRSMPHVARYHGERREREADWLAAMQYSTVPMQMIWGDADPVSGKRMREYAARRLTTMRCEQRADVGHYPQWEAPEWVARWVSRMERRTDV